MIKTSRLQSIYEDIFYFFGESSARRCFRNQSKALKALNQLASPADRLNSLLFSEWDPTNVMPRKVFLLHFRESHPIHQYRKKSGNYREKFMGPQGAGARSRPLIINKFWMRRQVGRNITSRRAVSPSGQTRLSCENLSPLKRRSEEETHDVDLKVPEARRTWRWDYCQKYIEAFMIDARAQVKRNFKLMMLRFLFPLSKSSSIIWSKLIAWVSKPLMREPN